MGNSKEPGPAHAGTRSVYKKWNWLSLIIALVNLIVYVRMESSGAFDSALRASGKAGSALVSYGAVVGLKAFAGEGWRFFDCLFVHEGLRHFLGNMCALFLAAPFLISAVGTIPTALIFVASGCLGNVAAAVTDPTAVVTGASGAIFGVYGALVAAFLSGKFGSHSPIERRQLKQAMVLSMPLSLLTSSLPGISFAANIGGLSSGFLIGLALTRKTLGSRMAWTVVSVSASFIGVFVVTVLTQGTHALFFQTLAHAIEEAPPASPMRELAESPTATSSPSIAPAFLPAPLPSPVVPQVTTTIETPIPSTHPSNAPSKKRPR